MREIIFAFYSLMFAGFCGGAFLHGVRQAQYIALGFVGAGCLYAVAGCSLMAFLIPLSFCTILFLLLKDDDVRYAYTLYQQIGVLVFSCVVSIVSLFNKMPEVQDTISIQSLIVTLAQENMHALMLFLCVAWASSMHVMENLSLQNKHGNKTKEAPHV